MKLPTPIVMCCATALVLLGQSQPAVNPDAAIQQEFQKRVNDYLKLRKTIKGQMPRLKPTASVEKIAHHERELAHKIREGAAFGEAGRYLFAGNQLRIPPSDHARDERAKGGASQGKPQERRTGCSSEDACRGEPQVSA
jgi:hypothetical protein